MGLTTKETIGDRTAIHAGRGGEARAGDARRGKSRTIGHIVLCYGGPIAEPEDVQFILRHTRDIASYFGASSMERLPTEPAITDRVREFRSLGTS
jgi:predicted TIM-barrel enzyme